MLEELLYYIGSRNPVQGKKIKKTLELHPEIKGDLSYFLEKFVPFMRQGNLEAKDLGDAYLHMIDEMLHARIEFMRSGKYPASDQSAVVSEVYNNPSVMTRYMLALALSEFLWLHHYKLIGFYREGVAALKKSKQCLEVGCGHGLAMLDLLSAHHREIEILDVVDISIASVNLAKSLLSTLKPAGREKVTLLHSDVKDYSPKRAYDFITMGEVLEHVPNPRDILLRLKELLKDDGVLYLSTCANCPAIDHVYHFKNVDEIQRMLIESGYTIEKEIIAPSEKVSPERLEELKLDISYAAFLRKIN